MCCHFFEAGTSPSLSLALCLPVFSYGRSTLSAIPLDSGCLYCLTSFSPSLLSPGPWQLLSQCFAPRDSGRGGWVGKRERKWHRGKNGSRRIDRDWFLGWRDTLWQLSGKSLAGIRQRDKRKQLKEAAIWQPCRSTVGSAFAQWRNVRLRGWLSIHICVEMSGVPWWLQLFISSFCALTAFQLSAECRHIFSGPT